MTVNALLLSDKRLYNAFCRIGLLHLLCLHFLYGSRYVGDGDTDQRESLHSGRAVSQNELASPFWWRYLYGSPNVGVKKGFGWTIVGLSDTDFCHLTANISKTVSRSVTCESEFIISSTSKAWGGSLSNSQGKVATLIK